MKILVRRITQELENAKQCGLYGPELSRVWPNNGNTRESAVALFAESNGLRLHYYKEGFCPIFDKDPYR